MDDYIRRNEAIDVLATMQGSCTSKAALVQNSKIWKQIKNLPSADVQPVRRGHWQEAKTRTYGIYECDVCKEWTYIPNEPRDYKFCPRCGARMDGE